MREAVNSLRPMPAWHA